MANLRNIIRELAKPDGEAVALVCTVDAVDEKARTIDCTPLNEGAPLLGVNLQANQGADYGFWVIPEVGSFVVVGFVADGAAGVVLSTEKIKQAEVVIGDTSAVMDADGCRIKTANMAADINADDIVFNGGKLNGLVIIQKLTDKLNELVQAFNSHTHTGAHGPTSTPLSQAKTFNKADYENEKIKQ